MEITFKEEIGEKTLSIQAGKVAKQAYAQGRPIRDVAAELTDLTDEEIDRLLDPAELTKGGIKS